MACQTTYTTQSVTEVEVSTNGSSWTDITAHVTTLTAPEQTRQTADTYVGASDYAVVTAGKLEPVDLVFRFLYSEGASDAWEVIRAVHQSSDPCLYVRYSPKGGDATEFRYNTSTNGTAAGAVPVSRLMFPGFDKANSAQPVMAGFTVRTPALFKETISA